MQRQSETLPAVREREELAPSKLTPERIKEVAEIIKLAEELVMDVLEPGIDWGLHPGTTSYALKDPGAAKILNAFNCYSDPDIIPRAVDKDQISFFIKTKLIDRKTGKVTGTGIGSCASTETKYKYRWLTAEDLDRENISKEGLKTKPKRKGSDELLYRVLNPEFLELENTIFKMACKRAEIDGAQGLPGVGTALGKLFGHPVERTYRWFWPLAKRLGFPTEDAVHKALGVSSMKDWLAQGRKLDEAIEVLISIPPQAATPAPAVATLAETKSELQGESIDHRTPAWQSVKLLLKETKPKAERVTEWFQKHHGIQVAITDFDSELPPEKFTFEALTGFYKELIRFKSTLRVDDK